MSGYAIANPTYETGGFFLNSVVSWHELAVYFGRLNLRNALNQYYNVYFLLGKWGLV